MSPWFEGLLDELSIRIEDASDAMGELIRSEVPEYRSFASPEQETQWLTGVRWAVGLFVEVQRRDPVGLSASEVAQIEAIGSERAEAGIPLSAVLNSVSFGMHAALQVVYRTARELDFDGVAEAVELVSFRMTRFVNDFSNAISSGYLRRSNARLSERERELAHVVGDLLAGIFDSYETFVDVGSAVGLELPSHLALLLVPAVGRPTSLLAIDVERSVAGVLVMPMASAAEPHTVLLVPAMGHGDWREARRLVGESASWHGLTVLACDPVSSPAALHKDYVESAPLVALASVRSDERGIVDAHRLIPSYLVTRASPPVLQAIERRVLDPLKQHNNGPKLLSALDTMYRAGGSSKAAARHLAVVDRTARRYRGEIEKATGLRFDHFEDVVWLALGCLLYRSSR